MGGKINGEVVDKRKIMMNSKISTRKNIDFDRTEQYSTM